MNTNIITNYVNIIKTPITSSNDPILWISLIGSVATFVSAILMFRSVKEMQRQREFEYTKLELSDLKEYISKNILPYIDYIENDSTDLSNILYIKIITLYTDNIYSKLLNLTIFSYNTFYEKKLNIIWHKINYLDCFIRNPNSSSDNVVKITNMIIKRVAQDLYKAFVDDDVFMLLCKTIDEYNQFLTNELKESDKNLILKYQEEQKTLKHLYNTNI